MTKHSTIETAIPPGEQTGAIAVFFPGEAAVDEALVSEAVQKINQIHENGALETARAMGEYLLATFFDGDLDGFRAKEKKHASFRALAEQEALTVGHSALWYSVAVLGQLRQLPAEVGAALPMSHHRLLLPVKDVKTKVKLANQALKSGLSKRAFEQLIREIREEENDGSHQGRPVLPGWAKGIGSIKAAIEAASADEITGDEIVVHRRSKAMARLDEVLAASGMLDRLRQKLEVALAEEAARD